MRRCPARVSAPGSGFAGFRFPPEVITLAVRWYLRYGVGAWNFATLGDLHVFVDDSAESITSDDFGVGGVGLGECS
jgi:hypothetical protein